VCSPVPRTTLFKAPLTKPRPTEQFEALHQRFTSSSVSTRALLLSAYAKLLNLYPEELGGQITPILAQQASYIDAEIQQRALEYHRLHLLQDPDLMVCMPCFF